MEVLIAAIALNVIGKILKKIDFVKDNYIPEILAGVGIVGFAIYYAIVGNFDWNVVIMNGVGSAAASVYVHQVIKQSIDLLPLEKATKDALQTVVKEAEDE